MPNFVTRSGFAFPQEDQPPSAHTHPCKTRAAPADDENMEPVNPRRAKRIRQPTAQIRTHVEEVAKSQARRAKKAHMPLRRIASSPPDDSDSAVDDWDSAEQREQDDDPHANDSEEPDPTGTPLMERDDMFTDTQIDISRPQPKKNRPVRPPTATPQSLPIERRTCPSPPLREIQNRAQLERERPRSLSPSPPRHLPLPPRRDHSQLHLHPSTMSSSSPQTTLGSQHSGHSRPTPSSLIDNPRGRSSHASSRRPRDESHSPSPASEEPPPVTKARKIGQEEESKSKRRSKPKVGDFDHEQQSTLKLACQYFRTFISTEHAFPSDFDGDSWAREAWKLACKEYDVDCTDTSAARKVIRARGSQLRGELKNHVRPLVVTHYNLVTSNKRSDNERTAALIERIMANNGLVYRDYEARKGLFENPILPKALNAQWFANHHGAGVNFHLYYNPIPTATMALVFSVIENCLHEWQSGVFKPLDYTEKAYKDVYEEHLASLKKWQGHAQGSAILGRMQQRLHDNARAHSGANPIEEDQPPRMTDEDFDAAVREAEEDESEALYQ